MPRFFIFILSFQAFLCGCSHAQNSQTTPQTLTEEHKLPQQSTTITAAVGVKCLLSAYPEFLVSADANSIYWKDGTKMIYDDEKVKKDFESLLNLANLKDQMSICYPKGAIGIASLPVNYDPGRIRHESFFYKMYGSTQEEVRKKLVPVAWLPKTLKETILVTSVNGIDKKVKAISEELDVLPSDLKKYLEKPGGTFLWRKIAGTQRQSTHSFGTTIDINVRYSNYWRYDKPDKNGLYKYVNRIPAKIVEIFEKHGFIWGGKWYHYDTMHFEYRPELLVDDCACKNSSK
jgi:hypothetical protein